MVKKFKSREKKEKVYSPKKAICLRVIVAVILLGVLVAGGYYLYESWQKAREIAEEYTFDYNEVARMGDDHVSMEEFMLYSTDVVTSYESTYGEDVWEETTLNSSGEKETYETVVKKEIIQEIRVVKALCKQAEKLGIEITEDEQSVISENADDYYEHLAQVGVTENEDMTKQVVTDFYEEEYLAQKVYSHYEEEYADGDDEDSTQLASAVAEVVQTYYPDFDEDNNINWELLDYLNFGDEEEDDTTYVVGDESSESEEERSEEN